MINIAGKAMTLLLLLPFLSGSALAAAAEPSTGQRPAQLDTQIALQMNYLLYLPADYEKQDSWPLLLFLHGAGERGSDLDKVKIHGPPKLIEQGKSFPFIVVSPQGRAGVWWQATELTALLDDIEKNYKVDKDRIYVTGLSMGGFGTWSLAAFTPHRFAAIAPICGGGELYWTKRLPHLPVWAFHGGKDKGVLPARSQVMVDALNKIGCNAKLTIYPEAGHNAWTETYADPKFYQWLLEQKRGAKG